MKKFRDQSLIGFTVSEIIQPLWALFTKLKESKSTYVITVVFLWAIRKNTVSTQNSFKRVGKNKHKQHKRSLPLG